MRVNNQVGAKFYACATAQNDDLNSAAFAALTWVEVEGVGRMTEVGRIQSATPYQTWGNAVAQKAKGAINAGDPELEVARNSADAGQDLLRSQAITNMQYAFKVEMPDKLTSGGTNTCRYYRGYVMGPRRPQGANEDVDVEIFNLGLVQDEVVVDPT